MKFVIVYLIRGKAEKYHQRLVRNIGPKFGENYMIEHPLPSHITLKSPFELRNSNELEKILKLFVAKQKTSSIIFGGFGNFKRFVSFVKIKLSKQALKTQADLLNELKRLKIKPHEFDLDFKPHATVSYGNTKDNFNKIWNHLKKLEEPKFNLKFDNLTILKKVGNSWKNYKTFNLE